MELAPRYCRSCGSRILVKNVCHNCNNDPLRGDNYCYDCGSLTPNAESCLHCGARYKTTFPVKPMLIIAGIFIAVIAAVGFFISRPSTSATVQDEKDQPDKTETVSQDVTNRDTTVNSPDTALLKKPADSSLTVISSDTATAKTDTVKPLSLNVFSPDQLSGYGRRCSYFIKGQRGQVLFFISGGSAFIRTNDNTVELKRKRKGTDVAVFGGGEFEATIRIDGLSGSEKEWLASCTLIVKDIVHNTSSRHKVYSSCIEL